VLKLMDFGIAKMLDREDKMTITGALVGSPAHMAPEIIEGEEAGPASDVFSLGTMLYLLATHQLPFTANNTTATLKRILDGNYEDPRQFLPTFSDDLAEILATCLARDPKARYRDAGKLRDALAGYLGGLGLSRVGEELSAFFLDAKAYRKKLVPRLADALIAQGERFLNERRPARALASLNHVLALVPDDARALALLEKMNQARRQERKVARRKRASLIAGGVLALAAAGVVAIAALPSGKSTKHAGEPAATAQASAPKTEPSTPQPTPGADSRTAAQVGADPQPSSAAAPEHAPSPSPSDAHAARSAQAARDAAPKAGPKPEHGAHVRDAPSASGAASAPALATRPEPNRAPIGPLVASADVPAHSSSGALPVVIKVRPFGYVQMDGGPRTPEARSQHALQASPGRHTLSVSCDFCEDVEEAIDVKSGGGNEFMIAAQLKPSRLSFEVQPPDALVRVGEEQRSARETQSRPFDVRFPRGFMGGRFSVPFEISAPGFRPAQGVAELTPGGAITLSRTLEPK